MTQQKLTSLEQDQELYNELAYYTLSHPAPAFIHQHLVDAYTAQHVDEAAKPIAAVFALVGLYLCVEKGFTGKQVQRAHMQLAKQRKNWPRLTPPAKVGAISVADVLAAQAGPERDEMIRQWCASVWEAWKDTQEQIRRLVKEELSIG
jgi:Family of unknown function (DUF5946)